MSMDDAYELISSGAYTRKLGSRSARFACFTIDDGYADNLTLALRYFAGTMYPFAFSSPQVLLLVLFFLDCSQ